MDDVIVVGAGWSGLVATAIALDKGLKVRLISQGIGTVIVTPGWISAWDGQADVIAAVRELITSARVPDHPYALAGIEALEQGLQFFRTFSAKLDLEYQPTTHALPSVLGTQQYPALVPAGYAADAGDAPLFVGFAGWRDYYPTLSGDHAHTATITLPGYADREWDATPTDLARAFDNPAFREQVAALIKPLLNVHVNGAKAVTAVGLPAVIGLEQSSTALRDLSESLGLPVFEMPTLPPSVPGTRLFTKMRRYFMDHRVRVQIGHPVVRGLVENGKCVGVEVAAAGKPQQFRSKSVILATGGLYSGGLFSDDRGSIWEPLFDLPVQYNKDRTRWFNADLLDPRGHPAHYFGVRVNERMQPISEWGEVVVEGLYLCGRMIAQPQAEGAPVPTACSEGVAIATAWKAVESLDVNEEI